MRVIKGIACGICSFALASAAWAGDGYNDRYNSSAGSSEYSSEYSPMSSQPIDTAPVIPGTESNGAELVFLEVPQQYVVVEEWYIFPSGDEPSLGG
jgi:hypothetical protein